MRTKLNKIEQRESINAQFRRINRVEFIPWASRDSDGHREDTDESDPSGDESTDDGSSSKNENAQT